MKAIKIILIIVLIITLFLNLSKHIVIFILDKKYNKNLNENDKCYYFSGLDCDNYIGKKYKEKNNGKCPRNNCPMRVNSKKHNIVDDLCENTIFNILNYVVEVLPQVSTAMLVIIDVLSKGE